MKNLKLKRFVATLAIMLVICYVWMGLEFLFYNEIQTRVVDDLIMLLFSPFIYICTTKYIK